MNKCKFAPSCLIRTVLGASKSCAASNCSDPQNFIIPQSFQVEIWESMRKRHADWIYSLYVVFHYIYIVENIFRDPYSQFIQKLPTKPLKIKEITVYNFQIGISWINKGKSNLSVL